MTGMLFTIVFFPLIGLAVSRLTRGANVILAGTGAAGLVLFVAAVWHVPLRPVIVAMTALALFVLYATRKRHAGSETPPAQPAGRQHAAMFGIGAIVVVMFVLAAILPLHDYDGRAFWMLKAKAIAHEGAVDGPFFQGATSYNPRNEYPLLVPIDAAAAMIVASSLDDQHVRWLFPLFALGFALELYRRCGAWCAAIFLVLPQILTDPDGGVLSAYADIALGAFAACAFFELTTRGSPLRLGLFTSFMMLTKNEGVPLAILLLAIGAFVFRKRIVIALGPPVVAAVHLAIWRSRIPRSDDGYAGMALLDLGDHLGRFAATLGHLAWNFLSWRDWGPFLALVLISAFVLGWRKEWHSLVLAAVVVVPALLLYAAVYAVSPWDVESMSANIAPRLLTHLLGPLFFVWSAARPVRSR